MNAEVISNLMAGIIEDTELYTEIAKERMQNYWRL